QRVIAFFRGRTLRRPSLANLIDRLIERLSGDAGFSKRARRGGPGGKRQGEQQALRRDEAVASLLSKLLGRIEQARRLRREIDLPGPAALDPRQLRKFRLQRLQGQGGVAARSTDQIGRQTFAVVE